MAAIRMDEAVIQRLITTQIEANRPTDLPFRAIGEPEPDGFTLLARLLSIEVRKRGRQSAEDHVDIAEVTVIAEVVIGETQTTATTYAIGSAVSALTHALDEKTLEDAATSHLIDLERANSVFGEQVSDLPGIVVARVTVQGFAKRTAGSSRADHIT